MKGRECPHCYEAADISRVYGMGVRLIENEGESIYVLTVEYNCPRCSDKCIFLLKHDKDKPLPSELYESILEALGQSQKNGKVSQENLSKISDKEVSDLRKAMEDASSFDQILRYLGVSKFEIKDIEDEQEPPQQDK